jgi:hypothetical protein
VSRTAADPLLATALPDPPYPGLRPPPAPAGQVQIIVTMRSEFLGDCARFDHFAEAINRAQYRVPRLTRAALNAFANAPDQIWLQTNEADALMMLNETDAARKIYLQYEGLQDAGDGNPWQTDVLNDFDKLTQLGDHYPLMQEISSDFVHATSTARQAPTVGRAPTARQAPGL